MCESVLIIYTTHHKPSPEFKRIKVDKLMRSKLVLALIMTDMILRKFINFQR